MNIAEIRSKYPQYQDMPDAALLRGLHGKFYKDIPYDKFVSKIDFKGSFADPGEIKSPTADMSGVQKFVAGAGKGFADLGRGAAQLVGAGPSPEQVRQTKEEDAPLMESGAGIAGNLAANVATAIPAAAIPGANTVAGAGVIGGISGLLQPVESGEERVKNTAIGGALGAGAQKVFGTVANKLAERTATKAAEKSQNALKDVTLKEVQEAGYVVPPSAVEPSFAAKRLESIAGKAAVGQEASMRNQQITNELARKALGLPKDDPISEGALETYRATQGKVYNDVSKLSNNAGIYLEQLKDARNEAKTYWNHANKTGDPNSLRNARKLDGDVERLEAKLEAEAVKIGKPELIPALQAARRAIAKSYDVEKALNVATGDIDARIIGTLLDKKGSKAVTGELATIGKFANAFSPYAREGSKVPTPGVSKLEALSALTLGVGGAAAAGPVGALLAAAPLASGPVRSFLLSKLGQQTLAKRGEPVVGNMATKLLPKDRAERLSKTVSPAFISTQDRD